MSERLVIVIEYEAESNSFTPLSEAIEQIRKVMHLPDQPNVRIVKVHSAILETADEVLAIFDPNKQVIPNPKRIKVKGLVPAMDGTDRLVPVEVEISDPEMIDKIQNGMIKDFSFKAQPVVQKE
jgi:hypothetical protein